MLASQTPALHSKDKQACLFSLRLRFIDLRSIDICTPLGNASKLALHSLRLRLALQTRTCQRARSCYSRKTSKLVVSRSAWGSSICDRQTSALRSALASKLALHSLRLRFIDLRSIDICTPLGNASKLALHSLRLRLAMPTACQTSAFHSALASKLAVHSLHLKLGYLFSACVFTISLLAMFCQWVGQRYCLLTSRSFLFANLLLANTL